MKISVLLATFNRKEKTLTCLDSLYRQVTALVPGELKLEVFLTDDASADGTAEAVQIRYPDVHIFKGSGSLFWAGGMRNSWTAARKTDPDFYLLLNDDTLLEAGALGKLLACNRSAICVGSTSDGKKISYGGHNLIHQNRVQYINVFSEDQYLPCDLANANIMLVPREVVASIGILSTAFTHSIADFDYSLRAKKAGFDVVVAPGILGYCTDDHGNNWKSSDTRLTDRIRYLKSPKGLAYSEYLYFIRQHFPTHLPAAFLKLWMKTLFPSIWDRLKSQA